MDEVQYIEKVFGVYIYDLKFRNNQCEKSDAFNEIKRLYWR